MDEAGGWDARMRGWGAVPPRSAQMVGKGEVGGGGGACWEHSVSSDMSLQCTLADREH